MNRLTIGRMTPVCAIGAAMGLMLVCGCNKAPTEQAKTPPTAQGTPAEHAEPVAKAIPLEEALAKAPTNAYPDLLGEIATMPSATSTLRIRHQQIVDFASPRTGEVVGMNSMTMGFPLGDGVSLDGFAEGDKVKFTLAVWTGLDSPSGFAFRLTKIEKIAADTVIDYTNKP